MPRTVFVLLVLLAGLSAAAAAAPPEIVLSSGCRGCHRLDGRGGTFAPTLDRIGSRFTAEQLASRLRNPRHAGDAKMPAYDHLSEAEIAEIARYLGTLK